MNLRRFENKARQSWWLVHIEAWRQSGLSRAKYCHQHGLTTTTFGRWLSYLVGKEAARKQAEYQAELSREQRREAQEKRRKGRARFRFGVSTDTRNRAVQAFWAIHVEAMNWTGMSVREYAVVLHPSADLSAQMARPAGRRRGGHRLARASSSLGPSARWH